MKTTIINGEKYYILKESDLNEMLASAFDSGIERGSRATQDAIYSNKLEKEETILVFESD